MKSTDAGRTWARLADFRALIRNLVLDPQDTAVVYASVKDWGIWKSKKAASFRIYPRV